MIRTTLKALTVFEDVLRGVAQLVVCALACIVTASAALAPGGATDDLEPVVQLTATAGAVGAWLAGKATAQRRRRRVDVLEANGVPVSVVLIAVVLPVAVGTVVLVSVATSTTAPPLVQTVTALRGLVGAGPSGLRPATTVATIAFTIAAFTLGAMRGLRSTSATPRRPTRGSRGRIVVAGAVSAAFLAPTVVIVLAGALPGVPLGSGPSTRLGSLAGIAGLPVLASAVVYAALPWSVLFLRPLLRSMARLAGAAGQRGSAFGRVVGASVAYAHAEAFVPLLTCCTSGLAVVSSAVVVRSIGAAVGGRSAGADLHELVLTLGPTTAIILVSVLANAGLATTALRTTSRVERQLGASMRQTAARRGTVMVLLAVASITAGLWPASAALAVTIAVLAGSGTTQPAPDAVTLALPCAAVIILVTIAVLLWDR